MSGWQAFYIAALTVALSTGRPGFSIVAAMTFDLLASVLFASDPVSVAVADLVAAVILIGHGRRANIIALIFVAMVLLEVIASRLHVENAIIYTVTDVLAFVQCGVIGGADRGVGRICRAIRRRGVAAGYSVAGGRYTRFGLARHIKTHSR